VNWAKIEKAYKPTYITPKGLASAKNGDFKPFRVKFFEIQKPDAAR
jgi:hypothetical protein